MNDYKNKEPIPTQPQKDYTHPDIEKVLKELEKEENKNNDR